MCIYGLFDCFKDWTTPLIAVIAAYIAYQQWKTNRQKFCLDRYPRYLQVYIATQDFLKAAMNGPTTTEERLQYEQATFDSPFLFDDDLSPYLEEIYDHVRQLDYWRDQYDASTKKQPTEYTHAEICAGQAKEKKWILAQRKEFTKARFIEYLDLADHSCLKRLRRYARRLRVRLSSQRKNPK
jgi:hypothetical protein